MKLYHGTNISSALNIQKFGVDVYISTGTNYRSLDFGTGFYTTDDYLSAYKWAKRKAYRTNDIACIVCLDFNITKAEKRIKRFKDIYEWGSFVVNNRYLDFEHNFDIVCGKIADTNIYKFGKHIKQKNYNCSLEDYQILDKFKGNALQYLFHTNDSLKFLNIIKLEVIDSYDKF